MIPRSEHPHFLRPMEIKPIVLKTELHPREFNGIRLLLINFPNLETVTIDLLPPSPIAVSFLNVNYIYPQNELYVTIYIYIYIYIYICGSLHIIKPCDNNFIFLRRLHHMLESIHRHTGCKTYHMSAREIF